MLFSERRHDLPFYLRAAERARGEVLEYGVGTGRVALHLARAGHAVTGVDSSPEMLACLAEAARAEPPSVQRLLRWHHGEAQTFSLGHRFELCICPFNGIAHHHGPAALARFLAKVHEHLAPAGLFAFDALLPDPARLGGLVAEIPWFRHPRTQRIHRCSETTSYDPLRRLLTVRIVLRPMEDHGEPQELALSLYQLLPDETPALLEQHGFELVDPPAGLGDVVAYLCRRRLGAAAAAEGTSP
ncbi:MAG: class I SAM-dependent methyltransferase [Deltaproteobacteria bacterium]|nr:class I SAM-dependent methyltransferase [Deltaproteobacteria bacterium]